MSTARRLRDTRRNEPGTSHQSSIQHTLPHDLDAERSVLGAILVHDEHLGTAATIVEPNHFFRDAHHIIFATMLALKQRGCAIDFVTVKNELLRRGALDDIGGPAYLSSLADTMPRATNVRVLCRDSAKLLGVPGLDRCRRAVGKRSLSAR